MTTINLRLLCAIAAACLCAGSLCAAAIPLAHDGKSDESTVPRKPTLDVPDALNVTYVPKLAYRECFNQDTLYDHAAFATRLKLNGHHNHIPPELGGHYTLIGWCHTSFDLIPPGQ